MYYYQENITSLDDLFKKYSNHKNTKQGSLNCVCIQFIKEELAVYIKISEMVLSI